MLLLSIADSKRANHLSLYTKTVLLSTKENVVVCVRACIHSVFITFVTFSNCINKRVKKKKRTEEFRSFCVLFGCFSVLLFLIEGSFYADPNGERWKEDDCLGTETHICGYIHLVCECFTYNIHMKTIEQSLDIQIHRGG